jgi:outer membrane murein-binding lipoprotein Lpp
MDRRRFVTAAVVAGVTVAGCTSPEDDDGDGDGEETGGGAYGKVDGRSPR